jgi:hypothetical protein
MFTEMLSQVCEIGDFVRRMRTQVRFGDLSRASLRLLRLELRAAEVECEWMARPADPWDADLPGSVRERRVAEQALKDAIAVRKLLFAVLPGVATAAIWVYREGPTPELIIAGIAKREEEPVVMGSRSLAMRVKLCGLQFRLDDGRLLPLQGDALG